MSTVNTDATVDLTKRLALVTLNVHTHNIVRPALNTKRELQKKAYPKANTRETEHRDELRALRQAHPRARVREAEVVQVRRRIRIKCRERDVEQRGGDEDDALTDSGTEDRYPLQCKVGDRVLLPPSVGGVQITITNAATNSLNVFPATGEQINSAGANTAFAIAGGKTTTFSCALATQWHALLSA